MSMRKRRLLMMVVLAVVLSLLFPHPTYAYIDPGTTGSAFAMLEPFTVVALAFLGFLIRPFRVFIASWAARLRQSHGTGNFAGNQLPGAAQTPEGEQGSEVGSEQHND